MKTYNTCKKEVAEKHRLGTTLVTGHTSKYYEEAALLYAREQAMAFSVYIQTNAIEYDPSSTCWSYAEDRGHTFEINDLWNEFLAQYKPTV